MPSSTLRGISRRERVGGAYDLHASLGVLRHGAWDPTYQVVDGVVWRGCRTPVGAATLRLVPHPSDGAVEATAWGPAAEWLVDGLPSLLGVTDDPAGLAPLVAGNRLLRDSARRNPGVRVIRTRSVFESLVPAILEQKVTNIEANRAWRTLVTRYGEPAHVPLSASARPLYCPPAPAALLRVPSWEWHRAGVDGKRSRAVLHACRVASRLEATTLRPHEEAERLLRTVPGIGVWTAAEVRQRAHGDPDAVSVGDFHLPGVVGFALAGERDADDERMLELLEPFRGHRYRVATLILLSGVRPPRHGPRLAPRDIRAI